MTMYRAAKVRASRLINPKKMDLAVEHLDRSGQPQTTGGVLVALWHLQVSDAIHDLCSGGSNIPPARRTNEVRILDIY